MEKLTRGGGRAPRPGRTPLFSEVRRILDLARLAKRPNMPPPDEIAEWAWTRRGFLKTSAASVAAGLVPKARLALAAARPKPRAPRIAVVGAGLAGLNAVYQLRKAGVRATLFGAPERIGGRIASNHHLMGPGLSIEFGGEFIDSEHADMHGLVREFGLELIDLKGPTERGLAVAYDFGGRRHSETQVIHDLLPLTDRINADIDSLPDGDVTFSHHNRAAVRMDRLSLREYLHEIGARGPIRDLLDVAYVDEYGLDSDRQSALNFLLQIGTDTSQGFKYYGTSDERFKIRGGNQRLIEAMADLLRDSIQLDRRLVAVRTRGRAYVLTFHRTSGKPVEVIADFVVLAIPFSTLRDVDLTGVPLPDVKRRAIRELGYGTNTKLFLGVTDRVWRHQGYFGDSFSDQPFQSTYDGTELEPDPRAALVVFLGGEAGLHVGKGTPEEEAERFLPGLNALFPGLSSKLDGRFARADWPAEPFAKGSYACYEPGQYTTIAGSEGLPVGRLAFAGEHCSLNFQGYMNGAAQTGRFAAVSILARLGVKVFHDFDVGESL